MKERIKQIRKHFKLTQKELAEKIGSTTAFISLMETGRSGLSDEKIELLCKEYHINASWVQDGVEPMLSDDPEDWILLPPYAEGEADVIADRIKELRETLDLSQSKIAKEIGVSRELVGLVEQKRTPPSKKLLTKIEETCNVNPDWLINGNGDMFLPEEQRKEPEETQQSQDEPDATRHHNSEVQEQQDSEHCVRCGGILKSDITFRCLEYTFPTMHLNEEPRTGYLIIKHIPCQKCENCGCERYSASIGNRLDDTIKDLFPVFSLERGFESPGRPGASVGDVIIQSWRK